MSVLRSYHYGQRKAVHHRIIPPVSRFVLRKGKRSCGAERGRSAAYEQSFLPLVSGKVTPRSLSLPPRHCRRFPSARGSVLAAFHLAKEAASDALLPGTARYA